MQGFGFRTQGLSEAFGCMSQAATGKQGLGLRLYKTGVPKPKGSIGELQGTLDATGVCKV